MAGDHGGDPVGGHLLGAHDGVDGQAVEEGVETGGLQVDVEVGGGQASVGQQGDGGGAGTPELVVDALVDGPLVGVDQGAGGEGEPDLALGATFVVQGDQLLEEALGGGPGAAWRGAGCMARTRARARSPTSCMAKQSSSAWVAK